MHVLSATFTQKLKKDYHMDEKDHNIYKVSSSVMGVAKLLTIMIKLFTLIKIICITAKTVR